MEEHRNKMEVIIFTVNYVINGEISITKGTRLTDYLDESKHSNEFIPVTNSIVSNKDRNELYKSKFLNVSRNYMELIIPASSLVLKESEGNSEQEN